MRWIEPAFTLPDGFPLGRCHALAHRPGGGHLLANLRPHGDGWGVLAWDAAGRLDGRWAAAHSAGAHGLFRDRDRDDHLWLVDRRGAIVRLAPDGTPSGALPPPATPRGARGWHPSELRRLPDGTLLVADGYGDGQLHRYDDAGRWITALGRSDAGDRDWDSLAEPHGFGVVHAGGAWEVWIADRGHGRLLRWCPRRGWLGPIGSGLRRPCTVVQTAAGIVVPDLHAQVMVLDASGAVRALLGDDPLAPQRPGWPHRTPRRAGACIAPHHALADGDGSLLLAEWIDGGRLVRIRP
jgi:hypothetical protein